MTVFVFATELGYKSGDFSVYKSLKRNFKNIYEMIWISDKYERERERVARVDRGRRDIGREHVEFG